MGYSTWWLAIALCFSALDTSKSLETTEPAEILFDSNETEPSVILFDSMATTEPAEILIDSNETTEPSVILFNEEEMENDDDDVDVMEDDKGKMEIPSRDFMDMNPTKVNGEPVFEGDMLLTHDQWRAVRERKGLASESSRWTEGSDGFPLIPYIFFSNSLDKVVIRQAMDHWSEHTCLKFEETTNTNQKYLKYIYDSGCYSYVGMITINGQAISIGNGCNRLGIVAHELGHAIGFVHEQSRPDRDEYVVINLENIENGREYNFRKADASTINSHNIMYDYSSDMHYSSTSFTTNGKTTIATINPLAQGLIGYRDGLSHRDKLLANIMYKCIDKWLTKCGVSTDPCQNEGYYGAACKCVCPPGTSGTNCETKTGSYYDALLNSCTKNVTTEGTITSPNYPNNYPIISCVKWIQAPECHVPKLTFSYFELYHRNDYCSGNSCCYFDALEIRTSNNNNGNVFCDTEIAPGSIFTSINRNMILFFRTRSNLRKGWSAELTFEKQAGCEVATNQKPTTQKPTTQKPTTQKTTTQKPTTQKPTTQKPTTQKPTTQKPTTQKPTTQKPTTQKPTTQKPTTQKPTTQKPITQKPTTELTTESTSMTTTEGSSPSCLIERYNGVYYWSSPGFGVRNYPNSFSCRLRGSSNSGKYGVYIRLNTFQLQGKTKRKCLDSVKLTTIGDRNKWLCGTRSGKTIISPSFNFAMEFNSNDAATAKGFNISLTPTLIDCNEVLEPAAGEMGTITASTWKQRKCEYTIVAPTGSQVRIDEIFPKIRKTWGGRRDMLIVNSNSEYTYPKETSKIFCGWSKVTDPITSTSGEMKVAYLGSRRSRGFELKYTIV